MTHQPTDKIRAHVYVSGIVQGVFYRGHTQRMARSLGLTGWVRNLPDGRVEAVFEGPRDAVHQAVRWCHTGSPSAYVERVDVHYEPATNEFRDFRVRW